MDSSKEMHTAGTPGSNIGPKIALTVVAFFVAFLGSCSNSKNRRNSGGDNPTAQVPIDQTPPVPAGEIDDVEQDNDVGTDDVPPVQDDVTTIDTTDGAAVKHLIMETSGNKEIGSGRYLSEFLFVVRAQEESCIRLKVRPSDGLQQQIDKKFIESDGGSAACETALVDDPPPADDPADGDQQDGDQAGDNQDGGDAPQGQVGDPVTNTGLTLAGLSSVTSSPAQADFWATHQRVTKPKALGLAETSICSVRLFRMPTLEKPVLGHGKGIEKVVTKTGRLVAVSPQVKVRVWIDDEVGNPCLGGTPADMDVVAFGPLHQEGVYVGHNDKILVSMFQNLADEAERGFNTLTTQYGAVSDIDANGSVDIFISPEVNRKFFVHEEQLKIDGFRALPIYRPQDLAAYNAQTNPTSNEGEIVYMWAPDPGGLYNYLNSPSANSLTTNYAKGYVGFQVMNLIQSNQKMLIQEGNPEDTWLAQSISFLASQYVAGIDFSFLFLAQYLTSRSNEISLTEPPDNALVKEEYLAMAYDETEGMRALFGWYLHTKLCATVDVNPCPAIKQLIDSQQRGIESVAEVVGKSFEEVLTHFGATVGVELVDNPTAARDLWGRAADPASLPELPMALPNLTEILVGASPQTVENSDDAGQVLAPGTDPTVAGPFPNKDSLIFQPILPDQEMDIKMAKHGVAYILVTGLVEQQTDITAVIGKGLNVTIVPLGERQGAIRQVHTEKVSENAHMDQRPINLTNDQEASRTYYAKPAYPSATDFTVTPDREIWALGSIDNFTIRQVDAETTVEDTDAYAIKFDPCAGAVDLATCQARTHTVVVQVYPRSGGPQVKPMVLTTSTRLGLFRGRSVWAKVADLDAKFKWGSPALGDDDANVPVFCQSEASVDFAITDGQPDRCANGGLSTAQFATDVCAAWDGEHVCDDGNSNQAIMFDHFNTITVDGNGDNFGFDAMWDNFFHSHPAGFPYFNNNSFRPDSMNDILRQARDFFPEETSRQFFRFGFEKEPKFQSLHFYALDASANFDPEIIQLGDAEIAALRNVYDAAVGNYFDPPNPDTPITEDDLEALKGDCELLEIPLASCVADFPDLATIGGILKAGFLADKRVVCKDDPTCGGVQFLLNEEWLPTERYNVYYTTGEAFHAFYSPIVPKSQSGFCAGIPGSTPAGECLFRDDSALGTDIRNQFNVPASRFSIGCGGQYVEDFDVCSDPYSYKQEIYPEEPFGFTPIQDVLPTDRNRSRNIDIATRAGEVIGKETRIYYNKFEIPGGQPTIINVMVGGRKQSQGKYLLRARVKNFD